MKNIILHVWSTVANKTAFISRLYLEKPVVFRKGNIWNFILLQH